MTAGAKVAGGSRGYSLIELMLVLAVSSIVTTIVAQIIYYQSKGFNYQLAYGETQQNARASLALIKRYVRMAGWGMTDEASAVGVAPIGSCYRTDDDKKDQYNCDNIDPDVEGNPGVDRLRVVYIMPDGGGALVNQPYRSDLASSGAINRIAAGRLTDPDTGVSLATPPGHPYDSNVYAVISGPCSGGGGYASDLVRITGVTANAGGLVHYEYQFVNVADDTQNLSCIYDSGFSFGRAVVADFWLDRATDPMHPALRVRLDPNDDLDDSHVVAHDIEDFQVRFLTDNACTIGSSSCTLGTEPDGVWDEECEDLLVGGAAACATAPANQRERAGRVLGVNIALVARTRHRDTSLGTASGPNITVYNHTYSGDIPSYGYRRWIYRTTVALRNKGL